MSEQNTLPCGVIGDLIPIDAEGLASHEAQAAIQTHIAICPACRGAYIEALKRRARQEMPVQDREFVTFFLRLRKRNVRQAVIAVALTLALFVAAVQVVYVREFVVPYDQIQWAQPRALADGRVVLEFTVKGMENVLLGRSASYVWSPLSQADAQTGYVMATYRLADKWFPRRSASRDPWEFMVESESVNTLRYGSPAGQSTPLWQRGATETPPADAAQEARYTWERGAGEPLLPAAQNEATQNPLDALVNAKLNIIYEAE